jgi:hypothetical protein
LQQLHQYAGMSGNSFRDHASNTAQQQQLAVRMQQQYQQAAGINRSGTYGVFVYVGHYLLLESVS